MQLANVIFVDSFHLVSGITIAREDDDKASYSIDVDKEFTVGVLKDFLESWLLLVTPFGTLLLPVKSKFEKRQSLCLLETDLEGITIGNRWIELHLLFQIVRYMLP